MKQELLGARRSQDEADPKQDQIRQLRKLLCLDSGQLWIVEFDLQIITACRLRMFYIFITVFDIICKYL